MPSPEVSILLNMPEGPAKNDAIVAFASGNNSTPDDLVKIFENLVVSGDRRILEALFGRPDMFDRWALEIGSNLYRVSLARLSADYPARLISGEDRRFEKKLHGHVFTDVASNILLLEDEPFFSKTMAAYLDELGMVVDSFEEVQFETTITSDAFWRLSVVEQAAKHLRAIRAAESACNCVLLEENPRDQAFP